MAKAKAVEVVFTARAQGFKESLAQVMSAASQLPRALQESFAQILSTTNSNLRHFSQSVALISAKGMEGLDPSEFLNRSNRLMRVAMDAMANDVDKTLNEVEARYKQSSVKFKVFYGKAVPGEDVGLPSGVRKEREQQSAVIEEKIRRTAALRSAKLAQLDPRIAFEAAGGSTTARRSVEHINSSLVRYDKILRNLVNKLSQLETMPFAIQLPSQVVKQKVIVGQDDIRRAGLLRPSGISSYTGASPALAKAQQMLLGNPQQRLAAQRRLLEEENRAGLTAHSRIINFEKGKERDAKARSKLADAENRAGLTVQSRIINFEKGRERDAKAISNKQDQLQRYRLSLMNGSKRLADAENRAGFVARARIEKDADDRARRISSGVLGTRGSSSLTNNTVAAKRIRDQFVEELRQKRLKIAEEITYKNEAEPTMYEVLGSLGGSPKGRRRRKAERERLERENEKRLDELTARHERLWDREQRVKESPLIGRARRGPSVGPNLSEEEIRANTIRANNLKKEAEDDARRRAESSKIGNEIVKNMSARLNREQRAEEKRHAQQERINKKAAADKEKDARDWVLFRKRIRAQEEKDEKIAHRNRIKAIVDEEIGVTKNRRKRAALTDLSARIGGETPEERRLRNIQSGSPGGGGGKNQFLGGWGSKLLIATGLVWSGIGYVQMAARGLGAAVNAVAQSEKFSNMLRTYIGLSDTAGKAMDGLSSMVRVTGGTIDKLTLSQNLARASMAGLSTDTMPQIIVAARVLSRAMGVDTTEAFDRLTRGITKQERRVLDELGIVLRASDAQRDYAAANNLTVSSLTAQDKEMAFQNAVLGQISTKYRRLGMDVSTATDTIDKMKVTWKEMGVVSGEALKPAGLFIARTAKGFLEFLRGPFLSMKNEVAQAMALSETGMVDFEKVLGTALNKSGANIQEFIHDLEELRKEATDGNKTEEERNDALEKLNGVLNRLAVSYPQLNAFISNHNFLLKNSVKLLEDRLKREQEFTNLLNGQSLAKQFEVYQNLGGIVDDLNIKAYSLNNRLSDLFSKRELDTKGWDDLNRQIMETEGRVTNIERIRQGIAESQFSKLGLDSENTDLMSSLFDIISRLAFARGIVGAGKDAGVDLGKAGALQYVLGSARSLLMPEVVSSEDEKTTTELIKSMLASGATEDSLSLLIQKFVRFGGGVAGTGSNKDANRVYESIMSKILSGQAILAGERVNQAFPGLKNGRKQLGNARRGFEKIMDPLWYGLAIPQTTPEATKANQTDMDNAFRDWEERKNEILNETLKDDLSRVENVYEGMKQEARKKAENQLTSGKFQPGSEEYVAIEVAKDEALEALEISMQEGLRNVYLAIEKLLTKAFNETIGKYESIKLDTESDSKMKEARRTINDSTRDAANKLTDSIKADKGAASIKAFEKQYSINMKDAASPIKLQEDAVKESKEAILRGLNNKSTANKVKTISDIRGSLQSALLLQSSMNTDTEVMKEKVRRELSVGSGALKGVALENAVADLTKEPIEDMKNIVGDLVAQLQSELEGELKTVAEKAEAVGTAFTMSADSVSDLMESFSELEAVDTNQLSTLENIEDRYKSITKAHLGWIRQIQTADEGLVKDLDDINEAMKSFGDDKSGESYRALESSGEAIKALRLVLKGFGTDVDRVAKRDIKVLDGAVSDFAKRLDTEALESLRKIRGEVRELYGTTTLLDRVGAAAGGQKMIRFGNVDISNMFNGVDISNMSSFKDLDQYIERVRETRASVAEEMKKLNVEIKSGNAGKDTKDSYSNLVDIFNDLGKEIDYMNANYRSFADVLESKQLDDILSSLGEAFKSKDLGTISEAILKVSNAITEAKNSPALEGLLIDYSRDYQRLFEILQNTRMSEEKIANFGQGTGYVKQISENLSPIIGRPASSAISNISNFVGSGYAGYIGLKDFRAKRGQTGGVSALDTMSMIAGLTGPIGEGISLASQAWKLFNVGAEKAKQRLEEINQAAKQMGDTIAGSISQGFEAGADSLETTVKKMMFGQYKDLLSNQLIDASGFTGILKSTETSRQNATRARDRLNKLVDKGAITREEANRLSGMGVGDLQTLLVETRAKAVKAEREIRAGSDVPATAGAEYRRYVSYANVVEAALAQKNSTLVFSKKLEGAGSAAAGLSESAQELQLQFDSFAESLGIQTKSNFDTNLPTATFRAITEPQANVLMSLSLEMRDIQRQIANNTGRTADVLANEVVPALGGRVITGGESSTSWAGVRRDLDTQTSGAGL